MSLIAHIEYLAERAVRFMGSGENTSLAELKNHLNCRASDLLIALGTLLPEGKIEIFREGPDTIVRLVQQDVKKEE